MEKFTTGGFPECGNIFIQTDSILGGNYVIMQTIRKIIAEMGEECRVDADMLHDALTKLPAEIYLQLYHKMQEKVLGYPPFYCGCGVTNMEEEKTE